MSSDNRNNDHRFDSDHSLWHNTSSYDGNSKILLLTIVSVSIIILIVFAYHLYTRFVFRRRSSSFQDLSQPPKRGLSPLVISSLPTFVVKVNGDDVVEAATECAVCLSLLEEKDTARRLPNCKHVFHVTCVDTWLTTQSTCPVCRTEVEPRLRLEPEPREGPVVDKIGGSSIMRLDSARRVLTRNSHSRVDQDHELDLERQ